MKILHTADWHLGKRLDHVSRLPEQQAVLNEICEIAEQQDVDAVIIAGDLFDQVNPSIEAIELFYKSLKRLANDGKRAVIGIAGNHDSPDRIEAPDPLARECGIILLGYPNSKVPLFTLESGLSVIETDEGFIELKLPKNETPLRLILTPYANEMRVKKYLGSEDREAALRDLLEMKWSDLAKTYCDEKGVNILMTHLFLMEKGGEKPVESEDEKSILSLGGAQEIFSKNLPQNLQYVALGHLHRCQTVKGQDYPIVYSGSPLSYSMSEAGQEKFVLILDAEAGEKVTWEKVPLTQGRTLVKKTCNSVEEACDWLAAHTDTWVELTLLTEDFLKAEERKKLYEIHDGIINIIPVLKDASQTDMPRADIDLNKDIEGLFHDYFQHKHGQAPNDTLLKLFQEVLAEDGEN